MVGTVNTGIDFAVLASLVYALGWPTLAANVVSYGCGVVCSYLLNRLYTFRDRARARRVGSGLALFAVTNGAGLLLNTTIVAALLPLVSPIVAKIGATLFAYAANYVMSARIVFPRLSRGPEVGEQRS